MKKFNEGDIVICYSSCIEGDFIKAKVIKAKGSHLNTFLGEGREIGGKTWRHSYNLGNIYSFLNNAFKLVPVEEEKVENKENILKVNIETGAMNIDLSKQETTGRDHTTSFGKGDVVVYNGREAARHGMKIEVLDVTGEYFNGFIVHVPNSFGLVDGNLVSAEVKKYVKVEEENILNEPQVKYPIGTILEYSGNKKLTLNVITAETIYEGQQTFKGKVNGAVVPEGFDTSKEYNWYVGNFRELEKEKQTNKFQEAMKTGVIVGDILETKDEKESELLKALKSIQIDIVKEESIATESEPKKRSTKEDQELRRWCVEQSLKHNGTNSIALEKADMLYKYITTGIK